MATAATDQLALFDLPPDRLWRLPEARRDRASRLATLVRNILWLHDKGGCRASNEFFASDPTMGLRCDVATIRRALADLELCGLIRREFDDFGQRTIIPLVTASQLIEAGWEALARAIVGMKQWAAELRQAARQLLQRLGKWHSFCPKKTDSSNSNCAASARTIARPFPYKGREAQKTTTDTSAKSEASPEAQKASVAVSASHKPEPLVETLPESAKLAIEAGLGTHAARTVTANKPLSAIKSAIQAAKAYAATHEVRNFPGLLSKAIREGWLPPAAPATHSSDLGCAPVAKKVKVRFGDQQNVKSDKAEVGPYVLGSGYEASKATLPWNRGK